MTSSWIVAGLGVALCVGAVWTARRHARRVAIPLPAMGAGRGSAVTIAAAAAIGVVALAGALVTSRPANGLPRSASPGGTVFVLDVSGSVSGGHARELAATLRAQALRTPRAGLVIFAERATEALPPSTPGIAIARLSRFFGMTGSSLADRLAGNGSTIYATSTPWPGAFLGDTVISTGIELARRMLMGTRGQTRRGSIVVVSDLNDGESASRLRSAITRALRGGVNVNAAPVDASPSDVALWTELGGQIEAGRSATASAASGTTHVAGHLPLIPIACAIAFGLLLAGLQLWARPLALPRPEERAA